MAVRVPPAMKDSGTIVHKEIELSKGNESGEDEEQIENIPNENGA